MPHEVPHEDSKWILASLLFPRLNNPALNLSQWSPLESTGKSHTGRGAQMHSHKCVWKVLYAFA